MQIVQPGVVADGHACIRATVQRTEAKASFKAPASAPAAKRYVGWNERMNPLTMLRVMALVTAFSVMSAHAAHATQSDVRRELEERMDRLVSLLSDNWSSEYHEFRRIQTVEISTGRELAAVMFSIEGYGGGNGHIQYLAVFANLDEGFEGHPRRLTLVDVEKVGGKSWRTVDFANVGVRMVGEKAEINLDVLEYAPGDGACCPSKKSKTTYHVAPNFTGRLLEDKK